MRKLLVSIIGLIAVGCSRPVSIVGTWDLKQMKSAQGAEMPITANTSLEFSADGKVTINAPIGSSQGTYTLDGAKLVITQNKSDALFAEGSSKSGTTTDETQVKIEGSTLTMTTSPSSSSHGAVLTFERRS